VSRPTSLPGETRSPQPARSRFERARSATERAAGLVLAVAALSACSQADPVFAGAGTTSTDAWQGVYHGPYHIYLKVDVQGQQASGNWRAVGERSGTFTGKLSGDRLAIAWEEHGDDGGAWSGRGYFVYRPAEGAVPPEIFGERGFGRSSSGTSWWAVKRPDTPLASEVVDTTSNGDTGDDRECSGCNDAGSDQDER
jgi:hypothetical protein